MTTVTSPEPVATNVVVGKALYVEMVSESGQHTTQLLFTPDYPVGGVKFALHSRTVSTTSPRKQWRISFAYGDRTTHAVDEATLLEENNKEVGRFARSVESFLRMNASRGFTIRQKPIVVEVTHEDLIDAKSWKTSIALQRRIQKARLALGFPEKLV